MNNPAFSKLRTFFQHIRQQQPPAGLQKSDVRLPQWEAPGGAPAILEGADAADEDCRRVPGRFGLTIRTAGPGNADELHELLARCGVSLSREQIAISRLAVMEEEAGSVLIADEWDPPTKPCGDGRLPRAGSAARMLAASSRKTTLKTRPGVDGGAGGDRQRRAASSRMERQGQAALRDGDLWTWNVGLGAGDANGLPGGISLKVDAGVDPQALAAVIAVLQRR